MRVRDISIEKIQYQLSIEECNINHDEIEDWVGEKYTVGDAVGDAVGVFVGDAVGDIVGDFVGKSVGDF